MDNNQINSEKITMATITEDYVSFKTAKLLKEKGFNEVCRSYFIANGGDIRYCGAPLKSKDMLGDQYLRPTLQLACKWLREVHNIDIITFHERLHKDSYWSRIEIYPYTEFQQDTNYYTTYEKSVEAAIKYCLENLI